MSPKIIANGVKIFDYKSLNTEDIHQWRWDTYQKLKGIHTYTLKDIQNMNARLPTENMIITTMLKEKTNQGYQVIFISFDSCIVCSVDIFKKMPSIKKSLKEEYDQEIYLVLVDTYISLIENKYKLANIDKYYHISHKTLKKYVNFIENHESGEFEYHCGIDFIYKVDFIAASNQLIIEEDKVIVLSSRVKEKNEQNDNAQLAILKNIETDNVHSKCAIFSNDKGMLKKSKNMKFITCVIKEDQMTWAYN